MQAPSAGVSCALDYLSAQAIVEVIVKVVAEAIVKPAIIAVWNSATLR
jgi:hypothetical protein